MSPQPERELVVPDTLHGARLDRIVAALLGLSRRDARMQIGAGVIWHRGKPLRVNAKELPAGTKLRVRAGDTSPSTPANPGALSVLHIDNHVVVITKPAGLLSEPDRAQSPSVLQELPPLLRAHGEKRLDVWLVHRLDAGTSGVMILARRPEPARVLSEAFRERRVHKEYLALCHGRLADAQIVDAPMARKDGRKHHVTPRGKPARTHVEPLAVGTRSTLVRALPETGRTHQIRVHLAHLGHPILGDRLYGGPGYTEGYAEGPSEPIGRFMLHAVRLELEHPSTRAPMRYEAPPPADFADLAARLGIDAHFARPGPTH